MPALGLGLIHLDLVVELMGLQVWKIWGWCSHKDDTHVQNHKPLLEYV